MIYLCRKRRPGISHPKSRLSDSDINQTNTGLTLDQLKHSQISFNEHGEIPDDIPEGLQDNIIYENKGIDAIPIYAKPIRTQTRKAVNETTQQQPDLSVDSSAGQSYDNHAVSNISDGTTSPSAGGVYETIKPKALSKAL